MINRQCLVVYLCFVNPLSFRRRRRHGSPADGRRTGRATGGGVNGRQRQAARVCRAFPGGARAAGRGLPMPARSKGGTGQRKGRQRDRAADGRQGRTGSQAAAGRRGGLACPRRGGNGRTGQRGRAAGKAAARGKPGGANAGRLNGAELGKRKAPHGAGLVRAGLVPCLGNGRRGRRGYQFAVNLIMQGIKGGKLIKVNRKPGEQIRRQPFKNGTGGKAPLRPFACAVIMTATAGKGGGMITCPIPYVTRRATAVCRCLNQSKGGGS